MIRLGYYSQTEFNSVAVPIIGATPKLIMFGKRLSRYLRLPLSHQSMIV
jgi:hypothetical protein